MKTTIQKHELIEIHTELEIALAKTEVIKTIRMSKTNRRTLTQARARILDSINKIKHYID